MILGLSMTSVTACGSAGGTAATRLRPPTPVNLAVYVTDSRISVSPTAIGAGPVVFIVTNQASHSESLSVAASGRSHPLASTAPINPQGTTQVAVTFKPGEYTIATMPHGRTDAQLSRPATIPPALLHIGHERPSASNSLLQP